MTFVGADGRELFTWEISSAGGRDQLSLRSQPNKEPVELNRAGTHAARIDEEQERVCLNRIGKLGTALKLYSGDHDETLPRTIDELLPDYLTERDRAEMISPFASDTKNS